MLVFPNCKINIGLIVSGKRTDGYHNIETIFYPLPFNDALEIIPSRDPKPSPAAGFTHSGILIDGEEKDNLCIKAYQILKRDFPQLPAVQIHLHKAIPIGAGLGGGSADAAFTLTALNEKYTLHLSHQQLLNYALELGSDCPFFIINKPCMATGRGEILKPLNLNLSGYRLILVNPAIPVNTGWAFSQLKIDGKTNLHQSLQAIVSQPISSWREALGNDFESPVFEKHPAIKDIKETLYEKGALFASMSGSGSSVFGLFEKEISPSFHFPENYLTRSLLL